MPSIKITVNHTGRQYPLAFSMRLFKMFCFYLKFYARRHFNGIRILNNSITLPHAYPTVVYSNHPSWWDPIIFMLLHRHFFADRPGFAPMEAEALERYPWFKKLGIFPVKLNNWSGARVFLECTKAILAQPQTVLWITPSGRFTDVRVLPTPFQPGIGHVLRMQSQVVVIPLALEYCFFNEVRPECVCAFGEPWVLNSVSDLTASELAIELQNRLTVVQNKLSNKAISRDKSSFCTLFDGNKNINFFYECYRWLLAKTNGKKYFSGHEDSHE